MKVFVTGGSGYIGRAVVAALVREGHTVEALARSERAADVVGGLGARAVTGGLTDLDVLNTAAARAQAVIYLAQADSGEADLAAAGAMQDGIGGGTYVHTGGSWVYGDTDGVSDEDAPWNPPALVAWRERVETEVLRRAERGGRPVVIRAGLVYGLGGGLIDIFYAGPARRDGVVSCIGEGTNHWSLIHVEDLAELYVAALRARPGAVYVGVGGVDPTARDAALAVSRALGIDGKVRSVSPAEARETMGPIADAFRLDQRFSPARARAELGWVPRHTDPLTVLAGG
ncbi:NAD-dependent epimerase/dehydratase family protein [Streptomyces sp. NPDC088387]|uniref:NAD-dependent epimerase/dehydratase family protein n=1 Tax=Streptomyces sp. NPDC088387 TaxID=3365859 RepID=UPI00382EF622